MVSNNKFGTKMPIKKEIQDIALKIDNSISDKEMEFILTLIEIIHNNELISFFTCYGSELQHKHSILINEALKISQDNLNKDAMSKLNELRYIIKKLNFTDVVEGKKRFWILPTKKTSIDSYRGMFNEKLVLVKDLKTELQLILSKITLFRTKLEKHESAINTLIRELEIHVIAAKIYAELSNEDIAKLLKSRASSLEMTIINCKTSRYINTISGSLYETEATINSIIQIWIVTWIHNTTELLSIKNLEFTSGDIALYNNLIEARNNILNKK